MKPEKQSRTAVRNGTKSAMHKKCQNATASVLRRARKHAAGKPPRALIAEFSFGSVDLMTIDPGTLFLVTNKKTKKFVNVFATTEDYAKHLAMSEHKIARNPDNLIVVPA